MLLHAAWDFGTLGLQATERGQKPAAGLIGLLAFAVAIVSMVVIVATA